MCGIAGFFAPNSNLAPDIFGGILKNMADAVLRRGPDAEGFWIDQELGLGLAHRRLSIVDLSPEGAQPMVSRSGRYVLVFNGEIYNHLDIRAELKGGSNGYANWRGHSDTETLLAAFDVLGIENTLSRAAGMFAMAVWDRRTKVLTLIRDRLGEKPIYYGWIGKTDLSTLIFGSDLAVFRQHPEFRPSINPDAVNDYARHGYVGGELAIYEGVKKLLPGHLIEIPLEGLSGVSRSWWSLTDVVKREQLDSRHLSFKEATDHLHSLLQKVVSQQMLSDVPLGAFLSGGVDSSTIVALMQSESKIPVKTFSLGFEEKSFNEAPYAKSVADYLKTDHVEFIVKSQDAIDTIQSLHEIYTEPFSDSSQIPTFLVSSMARKDVTVALTGDGGDEVFCGYNRYILASSISRYLSFIPNPVNNLTRILIECLSPDITDYIGKIFNIPHSYDKISKLKNILASSSPYERYEILVSIWSKNDHVLIRPTNFQPKFGEELWQDLKCSDVEKMMVMDLLNYLPNDILVKVDRAAMHSSLETRAPFLDHRVQEFAWSLPAEYKKSGQVSKRVLREVLYKYVPRDLIERPKMGFSLPIGAWLRGPLRDWAESLLSVEQLSKSGAFNPSVVRLKWHEHLTGKRNWQAQLWNVLMFQVWFVHGIPSE
jgi:asparagine synthase (glutamine-hydrolysing)